MNGPARIYRQVGIRRRRIRSLGLLEKEPFREDCTMDADRMDAKTRKRCRWLGFGIWKGVTHPERDISVFAAPDRLKSGLHGELIQGFRGIPVDQTPTCYEAGQKHGFNGFVRWSFFNHPEAERAIIGIDSSYYVAWNGGVAHTMCRLTEVACALARHELSHQCEVVLLDWRMTEHPRLETLRHELDLVTLGDWITKGPQLFMSPGPHCPRCGFRTFEEISRRFCSLCGCDPRVVLAHHSKTKEG